MYRYVLLLLLLPLFAGCQSGGPDTPKNAPAPTTSTTASAAPLTGSTATLVVFGMGCPMCANNIDRQLLKVPGVQKVDVDLGDGNVSVRFAPDAHPARQQLVDAVERSGFTLVDIRQP